MPVIYKTLFEIRLLHEYYLTNEGGNTIFEKQTQQEREDYLAKELSHDREPINDDIQFDFPQSLRSRYESYFLKLTPTYSGCRVSVKVLPVKLPDQSTVYEPLVPLANDLHIFILALRKNPGIDQYTNTRIRRSLPGIYYFSNADVIGTKTFPFLTNSIPAQDNSFAYEQGELSLSGITIQEFFRQGNNNIFRDVAGNGFANETDRLLMPNRFNYFIPDITNLTEATFVLKDNNGNELSSFTKTDAGGIKEKLYLDLSSSKPIPSNGSFVIDDYIHTLEVTGNNGYSVTHSILFTNDLISNNPWAVFDMRTSVSNAAFNLFANDGFLFRRKDQLGIWSPAPIFEVAVKSRLAYWRYTNNKGKEINVPAALNDYVDKEGKVLVTKTPRSLSRAWFLLEKENPAGTTYAPNPVSGILKIENDRRAFFDIRVPNSDLFPEP